MRADDFCTGTIAAGHRPQHLLQQRHRVRTTIRAASTRTGPTASRPSCAIRAPRSRTSRTRSAAARRSRPTRSRASSSASTIRPALDGAVLAGPGFSRSANDLQTTVDAVPRASPTTRPATTGSSSASRYNQADLFNLFVQNATGTLVFRNITDLRDGLLSPGTGNNQTATTPATSSAARPRARSATSPRPATSTTPRPQFERTHLLGLSLQDDWQVTDRLSVVARRPRRLVRRRRSATRTRTSCTATASATRPASTISTR